MNVRHGNLGDVSAILHHAPFCQLDPPAHAQPPIEVGLKKINDGGTPGKSGTRLGLVCRQYCPHTRHIKGSSTYPI